MKPVFMVLMFVSASLAGCLSSEDETTSQLEAIFDFDPDRNIRTDMEIDFDGGASLSANGGLTYKWDFDSDGAYDVPEGIMCGFPLMTTPSGEIEIVRDLTLSDNARSRLNLSVDELLSEREAVKDLL